MRERIPFKDMGMVTRVPRKPFLGGHSMGPEKRPFLQHHWTVLLLPPPGMATEVGNSHQTNIHVWLVQVTKIGHI